MKKIGIFGSSGMAREAGDIAWALGFQPVYVVRDLADLNGLDPSEEIILEQDLAAHRNIKYVVGIGDNNIRQKIVKQFCETLIFTNLIHPSATFGRLQRKKLDTSRGVIICAGSRFTNNIRIGNFSIFNQNSTIAHDVEVDDFVHIAPAACISGNVHILTRSWIGAGAVINQGTNSHKLTIGHDTTIGSGSVVIGNCEPNSVYAGVPARKIK